MNQNSTNSLDALPYVSGFVRKYNNFSFCCFEKIGIKEKQIGFYCTKCNKEVFSWQSKGVVIMQFEKKYNLEKIATIKNNIYDFRFWVFDFEAIKTALRENLTFDEVYNRFHCFNNR